MAGNDNAVRDAATLILMRPVADQPEDFELFMVKRHSKSGFMANAYVYPGGRLDDADGELVATSVVNEPANVSDPSDPVPGMANVAPSKARALLVACVREAFEEAGVLLAQHADGRDLGHGVADEIGERWRQKLNDGDASLADIAAAESVTFDLSGLRPFAHWITPEVEPRRYDTWFLSARAPSGQTLAHDDKETVDSDWLTPSEALARYDRGEIQLAPPTLATLQELRDLATMDAVSDRATSAPIPPIMPHFTQDEGDLTLLLPGDPSYPDADAVPVQRQTRIVLENGRWWTR